VWLRTGSVAVTTFGTLARLPPQARQAKTAMVIVDEAHYIKNRETVRSQGGRGRARARAACAIPDWHAHGDAAGWAAAAQRAEECPVNPGQHWAGVVSARYGELVSEHQDLGVLGCIGSAEQCQAAQHARLRGRDRVLGTHNRPPAAWRMSTTRSRWSSPRTGT
jgi:hypothetical protein